MRLSFLNDEKQKYHIVSTHWEKPIVYTVLIKENVCIPNKQTNVISYKAVVNCTKDKEQPICYYRIEKKEILINHKKPQNAFDHITLRIASVLNVLEFKMGYLGNIDQLLNFSEIQEKWLVERKKIVKEYQGASIDTYIRITNKMMEEEVLFLKLKKDPFLMNYFNSYVSGVENQESGIIAWDFFLGNTICYKHIQKQEESKNSLITITTQGEDIMSTEQKQSILDSIKKRNWLQNDKQKRDVVATLQHQIVVDQDTSQIQRVQTEHSLVVASQKVKSSLITIKKE